MAHENHHESDFIDKINAIFDHAKGKLLTVSTYWVWDEQWFWEETNGGVLQVALE
jgi:hypothetical protein